MWVEDGVIEFDYYAKNSYEYPQFGQENLNKTIYALRGGMFRATAKEDQFINKHEFDEIMTDSYSVKVKNLTISVGETQTGRSLDKRIVVQL